MKRRAPIIALLALACAPALAGPGPSGPPPGPPPIVRIAEQLGLDDTQKSEAKRIMDEARARTDAAARQSMAEADAELANVLTAEQLSEFKKLMKEARRHGPPPPDPSPSTNRSRTPKSYCVCPHEVDGAATTRGALPRRHRYALLVREIARRAPNTAARTRPDRDGHMSDLRMFPVIAMAMLQLAGCVTVRPGVTSILMFSGLGISTSGLLTYA